MFHGDESGERVETVNHLVSESTKLARREYKMRHDITGISPRNCAQREGLKELTNGMGRKESS